MCVRDLNSSFLTRTKIQNQDFKIPLHRFSRRKSNVIVMSGNLLNHFTTNMGNTKFKSKVKDDRPKYSSHEKPNSRLNILSDDVLLDGDFNKEHSELNRLKKSIKNNPDIFILNNLMMCVEFFKCYNEEMSEVSKILVSPREMTLNNRLLPQKRVLLPDVLQEQIDSNVVFISRRETIDPTMEPLQPIRMFVVYDNIEVSDEDDYSQYSSMNNTTIYNMRLKLSNHKGYVHLQRVGISPSQKNPTTEEETDLSSIAEDGVECISNGDSNYNSARHRSQQNRAIPSLIPNSSKHCDLSHLRPLPYPSQVTVTSNQVLVDLTKNKTIPNVLDDESPALSIYERRPSTGRNKINLDSSNNCKDDVDYEMMSESRSIQNRSLLSKRNPENQKRSRYAEYSKLKTGLSKASSASSTSSGYKSGNYDSDSDYGYSTVKNDGKSLDASEVPDSCFCQITYTADDRIYDPTENKKKGIISSKERIVQVERSRLNYYVWYLSSSRFRRHFYNVFIESLALPLDLEEAIKYRKPHCFGSVIYCDKVEINTTAKCNISESYEVIPCIWTHWPKYASEWLERPRNFWPNCEMIYNIMKSGCYIIPQEFGSKDDNINYKIEWQLTFPAAERYLETCINHAQMKVYIIVLMLHKTFIRGVESAPDRLNTHHIRHQLFWLIEKTQNEWVENRTGDYLINLLNCLCNCINQDEAFLKDYFVQGKNLFKNSEKGSLFFSLKQLKRILENPVMYVLHAMENIRYKSKVFPKLNYEELLRLLTAEELLLINPNLEKKVINFSPMQDYLEHNEVYNDRRGFWDDAKKKKEQFMTYSKRPVTNKTLINPSRAHDSVVDIAIRCGELRGIRLSKLLNFFVEHLIKMAEKYHEYGALQQKMDYLHHAMSLNILLTEDEMFKEETDSYFKQISVLKQQKVHSRSKNEAPEIPKRNSQKPNFSSSINSCSSTTFSVPLSNSQSSPTQMKKKSNPPVYVRPLKDRFSSTTIDVSSSSLPGLKKNKEVDISSQNTESNNFSDEANILKVREKIGMFEKKIEENYSDKKNNIEKKKDSHESEVTPLTDESEGLSQDTYI